MVRQFKHHEQKLLKKVDFFQWKSDNPKEQTMVRRHHLHKREDYVKYNKICGYITELASLVSQLQPDDPFRQKVAAQILDKLYQCGLITTKNTMSQLARVTATSMCRRRLSSVLVSLKMCQTLQEATTLVEQGHVRVGTEVVKDPAFFVTRTLEDFVTWVDNSKIRKKIATYYGTVDDYDMK
ncbi:U3 small nucleolar ribonucleoprotein IMP3 [Paramicrosporidium saccamoebae]|uniref:U3 small nucleolar ribonucleoprotein protein IMP3 n=1 Tax=Paramicrosporidium saccamoebae TaxID=1246581 RepID=A0A2H9THW3_9FUNG|nr:U3 small nucleolar ribonucleoprotein IMP3 [Paramicrosporidium saccamoebae]